MKGKTEGEKVKVSRSTTTEEHEQKIGNEMKDYARIRVNSLPSLFGGLFRLVSGHEAGRGESRFSKVDDCLLSTECGSDVGRRVLGVVLKISEWGF